MTSFSQDQIRFIVEQLAEGETAVAIIAAFGQRWKDTDCTPDDITAHHRENLREDWRAYFDGHRAKFVADAPAREKAFRIAMLDKMARDAKSRGFYDQAAKYIELIEKIDTGFFQGKAVATVPSGGSGEQVTAVEWTIVDPSDCKAEDAAGVCAPPGPQPI